MKGVSPKHWWQKFRGEKDPLEALFLLLFLGMLGFFCTLRYLDGGHLFIASA